VPTPEQRAREQIDAALVAAGWFVQDAKAANLRAGRGVAIREAPLARGHGYADYLLFVDGKACGAVEAKKLGVTLTGVEAQSEKYAHGLPGELPAHHRPLPFLYQTTSVETRFTNLLDPEPRSRGIFAFHKPETLANWLAEDPLWLPVVDGKPHPESQRPATLRGRLRHMPAFDGAGLWPAQVKAIRGLEASLSDGKPRALIQMATGSGKSRTAVAAIYRLVREAKASRVLFLVDRGNLGRQALKEFQQFDTPEGRKFHQEFIVQHLANNRLDHQARVVICTIQRLFSMLKGQEIEPTDEEGSAFLVSGTSEPVPVAYNPSIPVEAFDVIFTDECHRSIYNQWRQVLEYFDAFLVGLTATPASHTLAFFGRNIVMEYPREQAVADHCNVDFTVYRIRTRVTEAGSTVNAGEVVDKRDRETRRVRWEKLDGDVTYDAAQLDRDYVSSDQMRLVVRTIKERLFSEMFPGRTYVPKTLLFAKSDQHAEDLVQVIREEFGKGNDFCEKITYRTGTVRIPTGEVGPDGQPVFRYEAGATAEQLLQAFRNSFNPRIAVTVDMIATGTDVKPLEVVVFMRSVKSRILFEQMLGRGCRVLPDTDLRAVTPDAVTKDRFVVVDCVGVTESEFVDARPLEKNPTVPLDQLLKSVGLGNATPDTVSSLAGRLARLDRRLGEPEKAKLREIAGGVPLRDVVSGLVNALDPDKHLEEARAATRTPADRDPPADAVAKAAADLLKDALAPLATNPELRARLVDFKARAEQTIDRVTQDQLLDAGFDAHARERAKSVVESFQKFIVENRDRIAALQFFYSLPYAKRPRLNDLKALADEIHAPPHAWTEDLIWRAYEVLDQSKVKQRSAERLTTDLVSLVRYAIHREDRLVPFADKVEERYKNWLAQQETAGARFTSEQMEWLGAIKDHVAASYGIEKDDFDYDPFVQKGGLWKVHELFGERLGPMLDELNEALVA
jgi:type I restriction enzyme, R subunit